MFQQKNDRGHTSVTTKQLSKFLVHVRHTRKASQNIAKIHSSQYQSASHALDCWTTGSHEDFWHGEGPSHY
jgi:hypothetical protein